MATTTLEFDQRICVEVDMAKLAQLFWAMDDAQQAQFFVEFAKLTAGKSFDAEMQMHYLGHKLIGMGEPAHAARELVRSLLGSLDTQHYDWMPTVDNVNALHPKLREYVRDIEQKGPDELAREVAALRDESAKQKERIAYLEKAIADQRERERRRSSW